MRDVWRMDTPAARAPEPLFQALLRPHRSLSPRALKRVVGVILAGSLVVTGTMALLGAWPVIGFNGAEIALAVFLIRLNTRAARATEMISLNADGLEICRTDPRGRQERLVLPAYWLRIVLEERRGTVPRLLLQSQGRHVEIASQLGASEKRALAAALEAALHRWRSPRFDNPQLGD